MLGLSDKILAIVGGLFSVALAIVVVTQFFTIRSLHDAIDNPKTGWRVRLSTADNNYLQCKLNKGTLEDSIEKQNGSIDAARIAADAKAAAGLPIREQADANAKEGAKQIIELAKAKQGDDLAKSTDELILRTIR